MVVSLLEQTQQLLQQAPASPPDEFAALMSQAGLAELDHDPDRATPRSQPDADPALARLLPTGHLADPAVAAEFRALTQPGLIERKVARLAAASEVLAAATGDRISLALDEANALAIALTDVRLVLAERLGLETDDDARAIHDHQFEPGPDESKWADPRFALAMTYEFLTWMQESLVEALLKGGPRRDSSARD